MSHEQRFTKKGRGDWRITLIRSNARKISELPQPSLEPQSPVASKLVERGVTLKTVKALVAGFPHPFIEFQIEVFDWLMEIKDKKVAKSPAGYLVKSIEDEYKVPKGFKSKDQRTEETKARQDALQRKIEEDRRKKEIEAREENERKVRDAAVAAHLAGLSDEERAQLKLEFRAENGFGSGKVHFEAILFNAYMAKKLGLLEETESQA